MKKPTQQDLEEQYSELPIELPSFIKNKLNKQTKKKKV